MGGGAADGSDPASIVREGPRISRRRKVRPRRYRLSRGRSAQVLRRHTRHRWALDPAIFRVLDRAYGPVNLDSQWGSRLPDEPVYTGRMEDLRRYTLKSEDVTWCHPTPEQIGGTLQSLLRGSAEPGATALILLPKWTRAHWWPRTAELELLHRIERGAPLFTRPGPERGVVVRTPWAYRLFRYRVP